MERKVTLSKIIICLIAIAAGAGIMIAALTKAIQCPITYPVTLGAITTLTMLAVNPLMVVKENRMNTSSRVFCALTMGCVVTVIEFVLSRFVDFSLQMNWLTSLCTILLFSIFCGFVLRKK